MQGQSKDFEMFTKGDLKSSAQEHYDAYRNVEAFFGMKNIGKKEKVTISISLRALKRSLEMNPSNMESLILSGRIHAELLKNDLEALKWYSKALETVPNRSDVLYLKGVSLLKLGKKDAAKALLDEIDEESNYAAKLKNAINGKPSPAR